MKILLVNPNTSAPMTASIATAAREVAAAGIEIVPRQPSFGPRSIEGHYDEALAAGVAEQVRLAAAWRPDAVEIACFGDPVSAPTEF